MEVHILSVSYNVQIRHGTPGGLLGDWKQQIRVTANVPNEHPSNTITTASTTITQRIQVNNVISSGVLSSQGRCNQWG